MVTYLEAEVEHTSAVAAVDGASRHVSHSFFGRSRSLRSGDSENDRTEGESKRHDGELHVYCIVCLLFRLVGETLK